MGEDPVPRYFSDVRDAKGLHHDRVGDEFDSFDDARTQAQSLLPDIARAKLPDGDLHTVTCDVRNETGRVVYRGKITYLGTVDPA